MADAASFDDMMAEARKKAAAAAADQPAAQAQPSAAPGTPPAGSAAPGYQQMMEDARQRQQAAQAAADQAAAAARQPPPPQTTAYGVARNVAAGLPDAGANTINFLASPSGSFGQALATGAVTLHDFLAPYLGYERFPSDVRNLLLGDQVPQPGTQVINKAGNILGVDPSQVPAATDAERLARIATAVGVPAALTGGASLPAMVRAGVSGASGAVTGDVLSEYAPDWLKPGVQLAGNIAGAKAADVATGLGAKTINAAAGKTSDLMDAYNRLDINPRMLGDVSQSPTAQSLQAYATKAPGGAGVVNDAAQGVVGQFGNAVEKTAAMLDPQQAGRVATATQAGTVLQNEARNWRENFYRHDPSGANPGVQQAAWAPVDQAMAGAAVDPANYRASLTALATKLKGLDETTLALLPQKTRDMLAAINKDVPAGQSMTWEQARALRTAIGDVMGVPEIVQSVGKDQLTKAYGGISEDLKNSATANGQDQAFAAANKVSTDGHAFEENTLSKIISARNKSQEAIAPDKAHDAVINNNADLQAIRREMPNAANALGAFKIRDMAVATPGKAGATGQETSVATFLTDLNRYRQNNPDGAAALFADPKVAQRLDDLAKVSAAMKDTAGKLNVSNTGPQVWWGSIVPNAAGALAYHGNVGSAIATATLPFMANYLAGKAATSAPLTRFAATPGPQVPISPFAAAMAANLDAQRRQNALAVGLPRR